MLKLRRIELVGFKSFHDRSEISISDSGVTAVVGPNGCGKSNISDAVAWVLGEQRARSLRGDKMEDVIFSGSGRRSPLGMAEVSMSLVDDSPRSGNGNGNGNGGPPPGPVEMTVQRRLFRSGESQYLLNGRPCRLRDIQDIFLGTGLGPNSYAIIEQGRVGQILSARPTDRRTLIEEAAGVTRFKAKRKLAESRLQAAEKNLARVNDILSEVGRQRNSLRRQASKAGRYREIRSRMREVLARVFSTRAELLIAGQERVAAELEAMSGEGRELGERIAELDARVHEARVALEARERELEAARERQVDVKLDLEKAVQRIERQEDRVRSLETRRDDLAADLERILGDLEARRAAIDTATSTRTQLDTSVGALSEEIGRGESGVADLVRKRREEDEALESARNRRFEVVGREAQLGNEIGARRELLARVSGHMTRVRSERDEASDRAEQVSGNLAAVESERSALEEQIELLGHQIDDLDREIAEATTRHEGASERVSSVRSNEEAIRHRLATIRELSLERAYGTESLQDFFNRVREESWSPLGIVADFIDVEPEYESVIEDLLHTELQYVVVEDLLQAARALTLVRATSRGHLDFFVLDGPGSRSGSSVPIDGARPVSEVVRFDRRVQAFQDLVNDSWVVDDFRHAWDLSRNHTDQTFVARTGEVVRNRIVSWGGRSSHGPLSLKREMRDLARRGEEARQAVAGAEEDQRVERIRIDELSAGRNALVGRRRETETEILDLDHRLRALRDELERSRQRIRVSEGELERLDSERSDLEAGIARAVEETREIRATMEAVDEEIRTRTGATARLREEAETASSRLAEMRSRMAVFGERREAVDREIAALESQVRELGERRAWTGEQIELAAGQRQEALAQIAGDQSRRDALRVEAEELGVRIEGDLEALGLSRTGLRAAESGWDEARSALAAWKDRHSEAEIERTSIDSDLRHLVSMCQSELGEAIESVCLDTFETLSSEDLAAHEEEHRSLRQRLDSMGNVNMMAVEEFEEAEERFGFLSSQRQDLLDSIRDTSQAIREIDSVCTRQFSEAFREVNDRFRQSFVDLFGGGHGELRLIEEADTSDAGIEIVAQPPGKKLQNVLLLSGGEKALTALALIVALFRFRPSPFCVLDEVDAPLDEANVDRFANMIRLMSEETQFIVITHSKRTMETARQLYGVTMEEPGVSKVVSVRLN